jgi:hypothetical protein
MYVVDQPELSANLRVDPFQSNFADAIRAVRRRPGNCQNAIDGPVFPVPKGSRWRRLLVRQGDVITARGTGGRTTAS